MKQKINGNNHSKKNQYLDNSDISVALLIGDIKEAHTISQVFKKVGVVPQYYASLEEFWFSLFENIPTLALIDVTKMNEGGLLLKNHPMIKSESVPLAFYVPKNSAVLLTSTFELFNYGLIEQRINEIGYQGQVKSLLKRVNKFHKLEIERNALKDIEEKSQRKIQRVIEAHEQIKEKDFYNTLLKSMLAKIESGKELPDFESALIHVLENTHEILNFSLLELNHEGYKLISGVLPTPPTPSTPKYTHIPTLWLGKQCNDGIEFFAQNMVAQVGLEILGDNLVSLLIKGRALHPERIIIVKAGSEDVLNNFDWESLEYALSGLYTHFAYAHADSKLGHHHILNPWEFMELVGNKNNFICPSNVYGLLSVDFSDLIQVVKECGYKNFSFHSFFKDFWEKFEFQYRYKIKIAPLSFYNMTILTDGGNVDEVFHALRSYSLRYPYWKYFEDVDLVLAKDMAPIVKIINWDVDYFDSLGLKQESQSTPKREPKIGPERKQLTGRNLLDAF